ncbi:MAG TPA: NAD(P)H-dependent oxidoreductase [Tenuifilaceae bacterium]|nr:NAD(P)H-dependent oxidoreductase [Tenuifilaceae bacterium]HRX32222.1 NAD(P)H-dependent oxidoreductase [Tenuifilaceae bacterium]
MQLTVFNGSPRNKKSNSKILIEEFLKGYHRVCDTPVDIHYLANIKETTSHVEAFHQSEIAIIIFPLYTDCMPGIVKNFFEEIAKLDYSSPKRVGFIVQSGFPEAVHSTYVERYLQKLALRLNFEYLGTIIKGGVEGIQVMPPRMTKKLFDKFQKLGEYFAENEKFSAQIQEQLRKPLRMSATTRLLFNILRLVGLTNLYWNSNLKKNNAYKNRFDKPYAESTLN